MSGALFGNPTSINPMYVTSEYGMRLHPILGYVRLHAGIDLRTGCNTPLYAPRDATVLWSQWRNGFGNQVMLDYGTVEGNSVMSSSNHLTRSVVRAGQGVAKGQLIGYSGNTGPVRCLPPALRGLRERLDREPATSAGPLSGWRTARSEHAPGAARRHPRPPEGA